MSTILVVVLVVVALGTIVLLAAMITGLAEKHKSGHLPRKGGVGGAKRPGKGKSRR